jgi:hypothetical protein
MEGATQFRLVSLVSWSDTIDLLRLSPLVPGSERSGGSFGFFPSDDVTGDDETPGITGTAAGGADVNLPWSSSSTRDLDSLPPFRLFTVLARDANLLQRFVRGAPAYFERHAPPVTPQDLTSHNCINIRLPTAGHLYAWEFAKDGRTLDVRVDGQLICNSVLPVLSAALDGLGLAYVPFDLAKPHLKSGRLIEALSDWCPTFQGYHLYYPHRRQASPAFALLVEALRYRAD